MNPLSENTGKELKEQHFLKLINDLNILIQRQIQVDLKEKKYPTAEAHPLFEYYRAVATLNKTILTDKKKHKPILNKVNLDTVYEIVTDMNGRIA